MKKIALLMALLMLLGTLSGMAFAEETGGEALPEEAAEVVAEEAPAEVVTEETPVEVIATEAPAEEIREERQDAALPEVLSVTASWNHPLEKGMGVKFTVITTPNAKHLALFSENGTKCKVYHMSYNSTLAGEYREWHLLYFFKNGGERRITFRAAATRTYGPASEEFCFDQPFPPPKPDIDYIYVSSGHPFPGEQVTFHVHLINAAFCKSLAMFDEQGRKILTMTSDDDGAEGRRIEGDSWYFDYAFKNLGNRIMTVKLSTDGQNYFECKKGTREFAVLPPIYSIDYPAEVVAYEPVTFTVVSHTKANRLVLRLGDSGIWRNYRLKTWKASESSTVIDGRRVWTVQYTIKNAGDRVLKFGALCYPYLSPELPAQIPARYEFNIKVNPQE